MADDGGRAWVRDAERVQFATDGRNPCVVAEGLGGVAADSGSAGGAEIFG
jgi:hypothetical protein